MGGRVWDRERVSGPAEGLAAPPPGNVSTVEAKAFPRSTGPSGADSGRRCTRLCGRGSVGLLFFSCCFVASRGQWDSVMPLVMSCRDDNK